MRKRKIINRVIPEFERRERDQWKLLGMSVIFFCALAGSIWLLAPLISF